MPSRRFYVARSSDYEELKRTTRRKKLSLKKKPVGAPVNIPATAMELEDTDARQLLCDIEDTYVGS